MRRTFETNLATSDDPVPLTRTIPSRDLQARSSLCKVFETTMPMY